MSNYQAFVGALGQLEQDQSLFESLLGEELIGLHHENLVRSGGKMCHKFKHLAELGESFAATLSPDLIPKFTDAIQEYESLLMPPKVFGGMCPCFKPARDGPEYDRRFMVVMAKVATMVFLSQAVVLESKCEKLNMDSMHFADYANRLNTVHTTLAAIQSKGGDKAREGARLELQAATESVKRFMNAFEEDTSEFRGEYTRRVAQINELLASPSTDAAPPVGPTTVISRRLLVKAQSGLQEIMNSAAMVSMRKSTTSLADLETVARELKGVHDQELVILNELGPRMQQYALGEVIQPLQAASETVHTDTSSKIRDATKRWGSVRQQSQPRRVVEYQEEIVPNAPELGLMQLGGIVPGGAPSIQLPAHMTTNGELDPEKLMRNTGKKIGVLGKAAQKAALGVEKVIFKGLDTLTAAGQPQQQPQHQHQQQQLQQQQESQHHQQYQAMPQQQYHQSQPQQQQPQYQQLPQQPQQQQPQQPPKSQNHLAGFFGGS